MKTRKRMFLCTWALACCLAAASAEAGMIFEVQQGPAVHRRQETRQHSQRLQLGCAELKHRTLSYSRHKRLARPVKSGRLEVGGRGHSCGQAGHVAISDGPLAPQGRPGIALDGQASGGRRRVGVSVGSPEHRRRPHPEDQGAWGRWSMRLAANPADLAVHYVARQDYRQHTARYRPKASKSAAAAGTLRPRPAGSPSRTARPTRSSSSAWNGRATGPCA